MAHFRPRLHASVIPSKRISVVIATIALTIAVSTYGSTAAAGSTDCADVAMSATVPLPAVDQGYEVEAIVNDDCTVSVSEVRQITAAKAVRDAGSGASGEQRRPLGRIGSTSRHLDPDYHINSIAWDCCGIQMTRLVTDLSWTDDGFYVTGWHAGGYEAYHSESSCPFSPNGWYPVSGYLVNDLGGVGSQVIGVHSHQEWGYRGFFDSCDGSIYYTIFDNTLRGYGDGTGTCSFSRYMRHVASGFHIISQCYNPLTTIWDEQY